MKPCLRIFRFILSFFFVLLLLLGSLEQWLYTTFLSIEGAVSANINLGKVIFKKHQTELVPWKRFVVEESFSKENCQNNFTSPALMRDEKLTLICLEVDNTNTEGNSDLVRVGDNEWTLESILMRDIFPKYPRAAFIDIGSNVGINSVFAAAKLGREVFAFEPSLHALKFFTHSVAINSLRSDVKLYPYTLTESSYCTEININIQNNVKGLVIQETINCSSDAESGVPSVSNLDRLLPTLRKKRVKQAIIKFTSRTLQPEAFLGGLNLLKWIHVPVIEMDIKTMKIDYLLANETRNLKRKKIVDRFLKEMKDLGYVATPMSLHYNKSLSFGTIKLWPDRIFWRK